MNLPDSTLIHSSKTLQQSILQENEPEKAPTEEGEVKKEGEEETKEEQLQEVVEQEAPKLEPSPSGTASQTELKVNTSW